MNKQVHNKVVDNRLFNGSTAVEDVTSVETPDIEFVNDEIDIPGATAKLNVVSPYQVGAMTLTVNHNNGNGCDSLSTPEIHKLEMRIAQQVITAATGETGYKLVKVRAWGTPMSVSRGTVERGNPMGSSVKFALTRYEEEHEGKTTILIDALAGKLEMNGTDYAGAINRMLD